MKIADFTSLQWWVNAGVPLILWLLFGEILKKGFYALLGFLSSSVRGSNARAVNKLNEQARRLAASPRLYALEARLEMRARLDAILYGVIATFCLAVTAVTYLVREDHPVEVMMRWPLEVIDFSHYRVFLLVMGMLLLCASSFQMSKARRITAVIRAADLIIVRIEIAEEDRVK